MHKVSVELIFTGNELLIGKTLNTNSQWLAKRIYSLGAQITRMMSVGDTLDDISTALLEVIGRKPDIVITSGGLGPTFDDLTLDAVARATKRPLELSQEVLTLLYQIYEEKYNKGISKEKELSKYKRKMAYLPKGSIPLPNNIGTAPGVFLELEEYKGVKLFCLPGVPAELKAIFNQSIARIIMEMTGDIEMAEARFKTEQFIESEMAALVDKVTTAYPTVYIKSHPLGWEDTARVEFHLTSKGEKIEHITENVEKATAMLKKLVVNGGGKIIEETE
ncbi:MAG: competence/damage-inducible protein A [Promethearchaeota archaeon]